MVRSGSVEVIHDGRVLDLLGPGELFGQASMISGLPTAFEARAAEDTVCYRIPPTSCARCWPGPTCSGSWCGRLWTGPSRGCRRTGTFGSDPVQSRVGTLIRTPPLLCPGSEPIRDAAKRMTDQGASAALAPSTPRSVSSSTATCGRAWSPGPQPGRAGVAIMTEPPRS